MRTGWRIRQPVPSTNGPHERSIVATRKQLQEQKLFYLLNSSHLSLGELQSKTIVQRVVKQGRKPPAGSDIIDRRPIVRRPHVVKGTQIPASTLKCFQDGTKVPRKKSIKKLLLMYENIQYNRLRASGVNKKDAKRIKHYEPSAVQTAVSNYLRNARKIQANYEKSYEQKVKAYTKQEQEKLHPPKPKPIPPSKSVKPSKQKPSTEQPDAFYDDLLKEREPLPPGSKGYYYTDEEMYLEPPSEPPVDSFPLPPEELQPPIPEDYPSLDEVIWGMSESNHLESEWDNIADTSGLTKK